RWRAPSDVLFSVFGEKVTAHGSARTNAATPRHQSPHCWKPLHTLPIRKLYLFDYNDGTTIFYVFSVLINKLPIVFLESCMVERRIENKENTVM
ncbi:hypothetical protein J6590_091261, partial [Homalodisca vitripennis]